MSRRFDWRRVAWGAPDSPRRLLCSYCAGKLPEVPLMLSKPSGALAQFCDDCAGLLAQTSGLFQHTVRMTGRRCLRCGRFQDSSTAVEGRVTPQPGDICVCFDCAHIMAYKDDLSFRELTDPERVRLAGDLKLQRLVHAIRQKGGKS